jgi:hypothetical protein
MSRRICSSSLGRERAVNCVLGAPALAAGAPFPDRLFDRDDDFDLDRDPGRQRAHADRRAGVPAPIAKDFDEKVRAAVDDFRVVFEIGCGVDHAQHFDDPLDPVEIAALIAAISTRPTCRACRYPSSIEMPAPSLPRGIVPSARSGPLPER